MPRKKKRVSAAQKKAGKRLGAKAKKAKRIRRKGESWKSALRRANR